MAPRANWKGYLRLSLVSCPIALYPASSLSEKVSFNRINRKTGNRLKQQNVDSETGEVVAREDMVQAFELVRSHGGTPSQTVTRQTNVLVVGELGWPLLDDGRPSNKLNRAGAYGIPVVSERRFLEWIEKAVPDSLHRTYSAAQIASLSKLSSSTVDELTRFGLLNPRAGLFGFRDLASARQISKLFAHGIALSEIIRSVNEVRKWLPEADLSNLRFHPANHHDIEIQQPEGRTDKRGQFVLPVNHPNENADALFEQAQAAEETGEIAEAERLYRVLIKCDPTDAVPPFNLGNMLRASGRKVEAEAALRAATRADPTFAEAWYNLSDLLGEQGRSEAAIDCLRRALQGAPDYADAMFNLALLLQRGSRHKEAAEWWRQYLANDAQSEWAARARRSLKFCEMQIHLSAC
jgi:tetratricopeptide (TPR) repeat protein